MDKRGINLFTLFIVTLENTKLSSFNLLYSLRWSACFVTTAFLLQRMPNFWISSTIWQDIIKFILKYVQYFYF